MGKGIGTSTKILTVKVLLALVTDAQISTVSSQIQTPHTQPNTTTAPSTQLTSTSAVAARSQALGCARLRGLNVGVRRSSSSSSLAATSGPELAAQTTPQARQEPEPTVEEIEEREARDLADDKTAVDCELGQYEEGGVSTFMPLEHMTDLVRTCEVGLYVHSKIIVLSYFGFPDQ